MQQLLQSIATADPDRAPARRAFQVWGLDVSGLGVGFGDGLVVWEGFGGRFGVWFSTNGMAFGSRNRWLGLGEVREVFAFLAFLGLRCAGLGGILWEDLLGGVFRRFLRRIRVATNIRSV